MSDNKTHNDWLEEERRFCDDFMGGNINNNLTTEEKVGAPKNSEDKNKIKVCEDINEAFNEIANHYEEYKKAEPKKEQQSATENKEAITVKADDNKKKKKNNKKINKPKINLDDDNYDDEYDDTYDNYYD